jgi:MOSC domain-containing protein YiiM
MRLLSVNVSRPKAVPYGGKIVTTGIFKQSVEGRVRLRALIGQIRGGRPGERKLLGVMLGSPFTRSASGAITLSRLWNRRSPVDPSVR